MLKYFKIMFINTSRKQIKSLRVIIETFLYLLSHSTERACIGEMRNNAFITLESNLVG